MDPLPNATTTRETPHAEQRAPHDEDPEVVDAASLRKRLGGNLDLLGALLEVFREQRPLQLAALRAAVSRGDADGARTAAHRLVGTLGCFSATGATRVARELESAAGAGDLSRAASLVDECDRCLRALDPALARLAARGLAQGPSDGTPR